MDDILEVSNLQAFALVFVGGIMAAIIVYLLDFVVRPVESAVFTRRAA